jgi:hypothetical protein
MSLENWFLTHPFGVGPKSLEVIYTRTTGGTVTDLDSEPTWPSPTDGTVARFVIEGETTATLWELVASTHIDDPTNGWKRPLDYEATQNAKVWKRVGVFSSGGGGGATVVITGETPTGAINGTNVDYVTVNAFQTGSLEVFVNGLRMRVTADYTLTGVKNFRMLQALLTGDSLITNYILP